jgi:hypothetical protein
MSAEANKDSQSKDNMVAITGSGADDKYSREYPELSLERAGVPTPMKRRGSAGGIRRCAMHGLGV